MSLGTNMRRVFVTLLVITLAALPCAEWRGANASRQAMTKQQRAEKRRQERRLNISPAAPPAESRSAPPKEINATGDDDDDVVRVETNLTNILLTAMDKDKRFVTTLKREDVRVFENGQPQEISLFEREANLPLSLALLIDASKSQEEVMADEQASARAFLEAVLRPAKDNAAVISFNAEPTSEQPLTDDLTKLRQAIARVRVELPPDNPECEPVKDIDVPVDEDPRCWTGIWDSLWITVNEVLSHTPERTRRAVILLSDGEDTSSVTKRQEAIDFAVKHNVVVYAIGVRGFYGIKEDTLRKVAEPTGGRAFFPAGKAELAAAFTQIEQELRSQYLISYTPANKLRDGSYRQLKIEITNPELRKQKLRLLYRQGYYARNG